MGAMQRTVEDRLLNLELWETATTWFDTPFIHQQATVWGCDCVGLLVGVLKQMGYDASGADVKSRPLSAISDLLKDQVEQLAIKTEYYEPGCILLFRVGRYIQHLAIYNDGKIIHTDRTMEAVRHIDYHAELESRLAGIYLLDWGKIPRITASDKQQWNG